MTHEMLFAGFGGQGVLLAGQLMTYAGMIAGREVSWMPAYGPEMRGGTASCSVIVSDRLIGSPVVTRPGVLVAFNKPSLERFVGDVKADGVVIINSSLCDEPVERRDVKVYSVPMNELAAAMGNARVLNMIALGAAVAATQAVPLAAMEKAFMKRFGNERAINEANMKAVQEGVKCVFRYAALPESEVGSAG